MPDLLQSVLIQAGLALGPLRAIKTPDQAVAFFRQLGYEIPPGAFGPALPALSTEADQLLIGVGQLTEASGEGGVAAAIANVFTHVVAIGDAISQLHVKIQAGGGGALLNIGDLPRRVTDFLVLDLLERQRPEVHATLHLLGLIEHKPNPAPGQSSRLINWNRFGQILNEPSRIANDVYQWETDFDVEKFLTRMELTMRTASLPGGIYPQSATAQAALGNTTRGLRELRFPIFQKGLTPETYSQFGITFSPVEAQGAKKKGIALLPYLIGATAFDFEVCDRGELVFESTADIRGIGLVIHPPFNAEGLLNLTSAFQASVTIREKPTRAEENILFGSAGGTRLSIQGLGVKWFAQGPPEQLDLGFEAEVQKLRLAIAPGEGDGFLQEILSGRNVQAETGFAFGMTLLSGFTFKGGAKLALELRTHVDLGPVKVDGLRLSLEPADDHVVLETGAALKVDFGPLAAVVENVGLRSEVRFRPGNLGPADLDITFKPPSGVGLAIDATGVSGGGFLFLDPQSGNYAGTVQLNLESGIVVNALGLIATRLPDGSKGFSMLVVITAEGFKPYPLGLGFNLTGIGGLLAINRTFNEEVLRDGIKNHTLDSVLLPADPTRNALQLLSNLNKVFPIARGHHLLGPIVEIDWGTPTLFTMKLGIVLEIGARLRLLILGQVEAILPKKDNDLLRIKMDAVGVLDFDQGTASLDAVLYESRLLRKFVLTGGMALRMKWKGAPNFALAIGGMHHAFNPPANFPRLDRIAINLSAGDNPRITCEAYFAVTSNTVQFGARANLYAAAHGFSIEGDIGFDVLIQLDPFHFLAEFHASAQLKRGSHNLFKVAVEGALEGPRPLRARGKATFEILWCDISISFDKTLVEGDRPQPPSAINVLNKLAQALGDRRNWQEALPVGERRVVTVRELSAPNEVTIHPLGKVGVKQTVVPLNLTRDIDKFGSTTPSGPRRFSITNVTVGGLAQKPTPQTDFFAPAQFFEMTDDEKIASPPFDTMEAGFIVGVDDFGFNVADGKGAVLTYKTILVGTQTKISGTRKDDYTLKSDRLFEHARFGAAGRSDVRQTGTAKFQNRRRAPQVAVIKSGFVIASTEDLSPQAVPGVETGKPMNFIDAQEALRKLNQQNPAEAKKRQIVRSYELVH
jgi:hypothetical protein